MPMVRVAYLAAIDVDVNTDTNTVERVTAGEFTPDPGGVLVDLDTGRVLAVSDPVVVDGFRVAGSAPWPPIVFDSDI